MRFQPIYDIAEVCARKGIENAVLCPGSRCAPLTLAFTRNQKITSRTFSDERSAGFIALGIAQDSKSPVAVVCTSGTAAYNLAPSVAEAFFSETPMLVITADRPTEWIAQHDGQTIYQNEIFGKHAKKSFQLPQDYDHADSHWAINRIINDAINLSMQEPKGPVHINAPFREPLYPEKNETISFSPEIRVINEHRGEIQISENQEGFVRSSWAKYSKVLIVVGQGIFDEQLVASLEKISARHSIPVVSDIISNVHGNPNNINHSDLFLGQAPESIKKSLQPDLLITFGHSVVSKNLKLFLRKYNPSEHWHVQPAGIATDPFKNTTEVFQCSPVSFFNALETIPTLQDFESQKQKNFQNLWAIENRRVVRIAKDFFNAQEASELEVVKYLLENLPDNASLHLANSMSVRYANFLGLSAAQKNIATFSNRGTSGIDGCTSTAVGHCLSSRKPTILITGDVAFFYDRNAFWHNYPIENFRVLLLNNHGGLIFNMIDGPASLPEAGEYFITRQKLNAEFLSKEFGFDHLKIDNRRKVKNTFKEFLTFDGPTKILEFESDLNVNRAIFDKLKKTIKDSYES
jgi:2-succinyl-5-enolpyruvyl-6-hydroxy-3-cyclohexene-1-carboxylate synthase